MPCSKTQHGLTRVGLEPPTSVSGVRGINHQATALPRMFMCVYVCMYGGSTYRLETSCMDSSWKNSLDIFMVSPELSSLVKLRPFDKGVKFCKCRVSKSIIARNLKLVSANRG